MLVLVVEDEALVREIVCEFLEDLGFEVEQAETGDAALMMFQSGLNIDLLLTDVKMPGSIDGIELARQVGIIQPGAQTIIMSGHLGFSDAAHDGFANFLPKPFTCNRLFTMIGNIIPDRLMPKRNAFSTKGHTHLSEHLAISSRS